MRSAIPSVETSGVAVFAVAQAVEVDPLAADGMGEQHLRVEARRSSMLFWARCFAGPVEEAAPSVQDCSVLTHPSRADPRESLRSSPGFDLRPSASSRCFLSCALRAASISSRLPTMIWSSLLTV